MRRDSATLPPPPIGGEQCQAVETYRTLGEIMKLRKCVVVLLAMAVLGASPPPGVPPAPQPSAWSKLKSGAKRLIPGTATEQTSQPKVRYDDQVRPATAVAPQPRRRSFFKSPQQPRRSLSEYMAWEKP